MELKKIYCHSFLFLLLLSSCIKRFEPEIKNPDAVKYIIDGQVNRGDSIQVVKVSTTSSLFKPMERPVSGCIVKIIDGKGTEYPATDVWNGKYEAVIPENELVPGAIFKVDIQVATGDHIVSDFDEIQDCPVLNSVYYFRKEFPTQNPFYFTKGIQFYLDFNATNITCRNFRFDVIETWEYTATFPDYAERRVCWVTSKVRDIFVITTKNQIQNIYTHFPLHFVDNYSSQRLRFGYSLLVSQYSLSDAAWLYWQKLKVNTDEQGGLYESQPMQIKGNMHNLTDPSRDVLGFFGASTKNSRRIFVSNVPGLPDEFVECRPVTDPNERPNPECKDCTAKVGGTNIMPDFWPR